MKLISWNVNGIRACIKKGFWDWYDTEKPDVLGLQETKITEKDFLKLAEHHNLTPLDEVYRLNSPKLNDTTKVSHDLGGDLFDEPKNPIYFALDTAEKAGYSGVALLCRKKPKKVWLGLGIEKFDREGRTLTADFGDFIFVTTYVPNGGRELDRIPYKLEYSDALLDHLQKLRKKNKNVFVCGDFNVAHCPIDIARPKANEKNSGFTPIEREWFTKLLEHKYVDTFRAKHPNLKDHYSWWSYRAGARERNVGWRIDYFVTTPEGLEITKDAKILMDVLGSDHCPVSVRL